MYSRKGDVCKWTRFVRNKIKCELSTIEYKIRTDTMVDSYITKRTITVHVIRVSVYENGCSFTNLQTRLFELYLYEICEKGWIVYHTLWAKRPQLCLFARLSCMRRLLIIRLRLCRCQNLKGGRDMGHERSMNYSWHISPHLLVCSNRGAVLLVCTKGVHASPLRDFWFEHLACR